MDILATKNYMSFEMPILRLYDDYCSLDVTNIGRQIEIFIKILIGNLIL